MYGSNVHEAVVKRGVRVTGCTVHFVDEEYDHGPILAQSTIPVYPTDTPSDVASRLLPEEHKLFPKCVSALCEERISWRSDGVPILWNAK